MVTDAPSPAATCGSLVATARSMAVRLEEVLAAEFDALRDQRLEAFERMQPEKEAALAGLAQLLDEIRRSAGSLEAEIGRAHV